MGLKGTSCQHREHAAGWLQCVWMAVWELVGSFEGIMGLGCKRSGCCDMGEGYKGHTWSRNNMYSGVVKVGEFPF